VTEIEPDEDAPTPGRVGLALHGLRVVLFIAGAVILGSSDFDELGAGFYWGCALIALGFAAPQLPRLLHRNR
jgi:hypothetical protein